MAWELIRKRDISIAKISRKLSYINENILRRLWRDFHKIDVKIKKKNNFLFTRKLRKL
jgi:transposase-like protein